MSGRLDAMKALLAPLRLYSLDSGGLVDAELAAYAAAFSLLEEILAEIRLQAFVQTAEGESLMQYERLVGIQPRIGAPPESRREMVLYRLAVAPFDFNLRGMENSARAAGMDAAIVENYGEESLSIISRRLIDASTELESVKARLGTMLPAHLGIEFDIGVLTWDMFDAADPDWNNWDSQNFSWELFDLNGHNIFTGGGI